MIPLLNQLTVLIGSNMRRYREKWGHTQQEIAEVLNLDAQYYGEAERGRKRLSLECLTELCAYYGIPLDSLVPVAPREAEDERAGLLARLQTILDGCSSDQLALICLLAEDVRDSAGPRAALREQK